MTQSWYSCFTKIVHFRENDVGSCQHFMNGRNDAMIELSWHMAQYHLVHHLFCMHFLSIHMHLLNFTSTWGRDTFPPPPCLDWLNQEQLIRSDNSNILAQPKDLLWSVIFFPWLTVHRCVCQQGSWVAEYTFWSRCCKPCFSPTYSLSCPRHKSSPLRASTVCLISSPPQSIDASVHSILLPFHLFPRQTGS